MGPRLEEGRLRFFAHLPSPLECYLQAFFAGLFGLIFTIQCLFQSV